MNEIKYSTKSWHYRLVKYAWSGGWTYWTAPRNLCPYMRSIVAAIICVPLIFMWRQLPDVIKDHQDLARGLFIWGLIVHTATLLLTIAWGGVIEIDHYNDADNPAKITSTDHIKIEWWWGWAIYVGTVVSASIILGVIMVVESMVNDYRRRKKPDAGRTLQVFHDYIEAKHDKICPEITFIDEEKP